MGLWVNPDKIDDDQIFCADPIAYGPAFKIICAPLKAASPQDNFPWNTLTD